MDPRYLEVLAQLETAGGRKTIKGPKGEDSFNLFNIKDFSGRGFRAHDKAEGSNDAYRVYKSADESKADLIGLLSRKYPKALEAKSPLEFATALKAGGYATDPAYVDKFVRIAQGLGASSAAPQAPAATDPVPSPAPAADRSLEALYAAAQGPRPPKALKQTKLAAAAAAVAAAQPLPLAPGAAEADWFTRSSEAARDAKKATQEAEKQSFLDISRAQFWGTMGGTLVQRLARPEYEPDGTLASEDELAGYTQEEQDHIRAGASVAERQRLRFDIDYNKEQREVGMKSGLGWAIAGSIVAGAPEGAALGVGVAAGLARVGMGSLQLAKAGKQGAAVASSVAENAGVNVAVTALQDHMTPDVHGADYVIGALGGVVGTLAVAPSIFRAGKNIEDDALRGILDTAVQDRHTRVAAARAELGEDATPAEVNKLAVARQVEEVQADLGAQRGGVPADRKLIDDDTNAELMGDKPEAPEGEGTFDASMWDTGTPAAKHASEDPAHFSKTPLADRTRYFERDPSALIEAGEGMTIQAMRRLQPGVTLGPQVKAAAHLRPAAAAVKDLVEQMLPGKRVVLAVADDVKLSARATAQLGRKVAANGVVYSTTEGHVIGLSGAPRTPTEAMLTAVHEVGHVIFHEKFPDIPKPLLSRMVAEHGEFLAEMRAGKEAARLKRFSEGSNNVVDEKGALRGRLPDDAYTASFDEYTAESFTRWVQQRARSGKSDLQLDKGVVALIKSAWESVKRLWELALQKGYLAKDEAFHEFFDRVLQGTLKDADMAPTGFLDDSIKLPDLGDFSVAARTDADIIRDYGLDVLASKSAAQRATLKAMVGLYRKAEAYPMPDQARMSKLLSSSAMQAVAPTALKLLNSKNPVARMAAAELLESGGGAGGRRTTAAIHKWQREQEFMGNAVNDFQRLYHDWRNVNGGNTREDFLKGEKFKAFNRAVATELEDRLQGRAGTGNASVSQAADVMEQAYERMRIAQKTTKTPGWAALPESSIGYMPHRMSPGTVRALTPGQARAVHSALAQQFEALEGFDADFSKQLASKYLGVIKQRGTSGYSAPMGVASSDAADIVEESARAMGMSADEAAALAKRVQRAAPAHTRHRLQLDLTASHQLEDGSTFKLLDLFETDQLTLLRSQASRVSGEVALVRHGIMGSTGMKLLRQAMSDFGTDKATNAELEAFDQVSAEFLGRPFGNSGGVWLDRALTFNSLSSLGGIGFNQAAEFLNGAVTLGVRHALSAVGGFGRLRSEIIALSKGQAVDNPIIGSIELYGGAEFGTGHYKLVFPFDRPDRHTEVFGSDDLTVADRLLRAGSHLQGKLSLWRAITAAQERGMAEQIVHKALRYVNEGKESKALADMGFDPDTVAALKAELPRIARFDNGRLVEFDITKMENQQAADAMVQAVHRGTRQIIQGAFIGETGKWAHSGFLRLLTQFRTFSLIAIDKQWNRQVGNHGTAAALGMLIGTMSFAAPIYMVRAGLQSLGRPDQDEFLEKKLAPTTIAREVLNYTALSGLSGDLLDALGSVAGVQATGGRSGSNKSFVGNVVAPAAGKANDIWGAIQNNREGTDIHGAVSQLPFARLPWLYPAVNALRDE